MEFHTTETEPPWRLSQYTSPIREFANNNDRVTTQWVRHHYFNNPNQSTRSCLFLYSKDKIEFSHRAAGNNWIIMSALLSPPPLTPTGAVEDGSTDQGFVTRSCDPPRSFVRILIQQKLAYGASCVVLAAWYFLATTAMVRVVTTRRPPETVSACYCHQQWPPEERPSESPWPQPYYLWYTESIVIANLSCV